jgi:hypothetical protein
MNTEHKLESGRDSKAVFNGLGQLAWRIRGNISRKLGYLTVFKNGVKRWRFRQGTLAILLMTILATFWKGIQRRIRFHVPEVVARTKPN